jgi:signal transduction histidine kinase
VTSPIIRRLRAALTSVALVAAVTAVIALLEPKVPELGLGVLYLLAILPVTLMYGAAAAAATAVASMVAFSYFFVPPLHQLSPGTSERWSVLLAFLLSSLVVSQLAARSQREARRATMLAEEQAALRRVATLVARGVAPPEVFAAATREAGLLLGVDATHMARYEPGATATGVASWSPAGDETLVDTHFDLEGESVAGLVLRTGRPARMDGYEHASGPAAELGRRLGLRWAVGAPIVVERRLWGVMIASSKTRRARPADAEARIEAFTELLATAIANAESRAGLAQLAEEQAALRRVATLVARGAPPEELFAAVADEGRRVLPVDVMSMARYEPDGTMTAVALSGNVGDAFTVGSRWPLEGKNISAIVAHTGRPARLDSYADASGRLGDAIREHGLQASVGTPIVVEGRVWGVLIASSEPGQPLPADTEARLASFTELVATAIANIEARAEVEASRARIVAAADEERRRVVRDLHDGAQQRLVHTIVTLRMAHSALENEQDEEIPALVAEALDNAEQATVELRELTHGILPTVLTKGGLRPGVEALAARTPVPVEIDVPVGRLPAPVEATAYFVVAEALTNVAKHARAGRAEVTAGVEGGTLRVQVRDDGVGGAHPSGSGLLGLADRVAALGGRLGIESPADGGTLVTATVPTAELTA